MIFFLIQETELKDFFFSLAKKETAKRNTRNAGRKTSNQFDFS